MMTNKDQFDFWYAVNNTEILIRPSQQLETFGSTILNYHLICELMDSVNQVRVREGRIEAFRPQIITPQSFSQDNFEGFHSDANQYIDWLRENQKNLYILKYGFTVKKHDTSDHIISDSLPTVLDRVKTNLEAKKDPFSALAIGVEKPWEVCLLKLMIDVIEYSAEGNIRDLESKNLFEQSRNDPQGIRRKIEDAFLKAAKDPSRVKALGKLLQRLNVFNEYEDRFFSLLKTS